MAKTKIIFGQKWYWNITIVNPVHLNLSSHIISEIHSTHVIVMFSCSVSQETPSLTIFQLCFKIIHRDHFYCNSVQSLLQICNFFLDSKEVFNPLKIFDKSCCLNACLSVDFSYHPKIIKVLVCYLSWLQNICLLQRRVFFKLSHFWVYWTINYLRLPIRLDSMIIFCSIFI